MSAEVNISDMHRQCSFPLRRQAVAMSDCCRAHATSAAVWPDGRRMWRCPRHAGMLDIQGLRGPIIYRLPREVFFPEERDPTDAELDREQLCLQLTGRGVCGMLIGHDGRCGKERPMPEPWHVSTLPSDDPEPPWISGQIGIGEQVVTFRIALSGISGRYEFAQWGAPAETLGQTVEVMEALTAAMERTATTP